MSSCEHISVPSLGEGPLYQIEGRSAMLCYEDGKAVLRMYKENLLESTEQFPLSIWDLVREMGTIWMVKGITPKQAEEANRRAGF